MTPLALVPMVASAALVSGAAVWWHRRRRAARPRVRLEELEFVAIDVETTGLDPRRDDLVALAAIPFADGRPRFDEAYVQVVNPGRSIPPDAQAIHGISDRDVLHAPAPGAALRAFLEVCRDRAVVAHTASFDLAIINRTARAAGLRPVGGHVLDIGVIAHAVFPSWWDLSLEGLARLLETEVIDRHTARGDALSAGVIFLRMIPLLKRHGVETLAAALRLQRRGTIVPSGPGATGGGLAGP